ncbi:MAG TPA: hypothetical protein VLZ83_04370 [Edaphocola sp.]|nr:hypothetical protein [Edaphocola sp.]
MTIRATSYCYTIILFLFVSLHAQGQLAGMFELGTGTQGKEPLSYDAGISVGQVLLKSQGYSFVGIKAQKFPLIPPHKLRGSEDNYLGQTMDLWHFSIYCGLRYSINLFKIKKESDNRFGIFPEARLYFSPLLPREINYSEDNYPNQSNLITLKGKSISQWAYGCGGGIYYGNPKVAYLSLKYEMSTIDIFESLRALDYKNDTFDTRGYQHIISLSLYVNIN